MIVTPRTLTHIAPSKVESRADEALTEKSFLSKNVVQQEEFRRLRQYAKNRSIPILIEGPTGTGKTTLAKAVHSLSPRRGQAFKQLCLSAVEDSLSASELFGHVAGAFTDARQTRKGAFLAANGGTLFLDEIGKASLKLQMMLLASVETGTIIPQGSDAEIHTDVRIISASNTKLESLTTTGQFLPDLGARLGLFKIRLLPLRDRPEDIGDLVLDIVRRRSLLLGFEEPPRVDADLLSALQSAEWPLNIRELDAALTKMLFEARQSTEQELTFQHCVGELEFLRRIVHRKSVRQVTPDDVLSAAHTSGSRADLAKKLGVSEATLYRRLRKDPSQSLSNE